MNRKKTLIASALALALTLCSWTSAFADTPADLAPGTPADTASGSPSSLSSGQENEGATPDGRNEPEEPETAELPETADVAKKPEAPKESAKEKQPGARQKNTETVSHPICEKSTPNLEKSGPASWRRFSSMPVRNMTWIRKSSWRSPSGKAASTPKLPVRTAIRA